MSDLSSFFSSTPGSGIGGLQWSVVSADTTAVSSAGYMFDNSATTHTLTLPSSPAVGNTVGYKDLNGSFNSFPLTINGNGAKIQGYTDTMSIDTANGYGILTYSGATQGWILTSASVGAPVVGKPMMHVQYTQPQGTSGGTSIAGTQAAPLNTVKLNQISGASLVGNDISLAAGTYFFDVSYAVGANPVFVSKLRLYNVTTSSYVAEGENLVSSGTVVLQTQQTISTATTFEVRLYTQTSVANVLGAPVSQGVETYCDCKIWQIDADRVYTPKVYQPINQPITGAYTTGNIYGGELVYINTTQFSVNAFSCMSDDLTTPLFINASTSVTLSSPVLNTIYYAWAVKYNTGLYGIKTDTDINGVNLGATVIAKRRLGFVITNASAQIMPFVMAGDTIDWTVTTNRPILTSSITAAYVSYSISAIVPVAILLNVAIQAQSILTYISYDGTTDYTVSGTASNMGPIVNLRPVSNIYLKYSSSSSAVHILSVTLRR